jgi:hypothetical protein
MRSIRTLASSCAIPRAIATRTSTICAAAIQNVFGVSQLEGGVKYSSQLLSLYATVFYNKNNNFDSTVGSVVANSQFKTRAYGLELDSNLRLGAFGFATLATLQNAKVTASSTPTGGQRSAPSAEVPDPPFAEL